MPGLFPRREATECADTPQNEPLPNPLSLGASIIHVPARSSPAQNRSRWFSVTYICAGKGSPGLRGSVRGWGDWLPKLAAAHPIHPPSLFRSWSPPPGLRVGQRLDSVFLVPARCFLRGETRASSRERGGPFWWPGVCVRRGHFGFPVLVEAAALLGHPREEGWESRLAG